MDQPGRKSSIIVFFLLLISVIGIAFFVYLRNQNMDLKDIRVDELFGGIFQSASKNGVKSVTEIKYDAKDHPEFCVYRDYIIKCTSDSIKWLDKKGEEQKSIQVSLSKPVLKVAGRFLLVADMDGKDVYEISGKDVKWNRKVENNIINVDINEDGYVSVVQDAKGYKAMVAVFNPQGMEKFTRSIAENFILSAKVLPTGEQVLLNRVDTSGIRANTSLEYNEITSDKPFANIPLNDAVFPALWYLKDGSLITVSDSMILCFDKERKERWKKEYSTISSSNVSLDKYAVIAVHSESKAGISGNGKAEVQIWNTKGEEMGSYSLRDIVISTGTFDDLIAVNTGAEVHFINTKGKLFRKYNSKTDVIAVYLFSRQEALVVTKSSVTVVPI